MGLSKKGPKKKKGSMNIQHIIRKDQDEQAKGKEKKEDEWYRRFEGNLKFIRLRKRWTIKDQQKK